MDGFVFVGTHRALTTEDYWFDIEEYRRGQESFLLAHLRFDRFTPSVLKRALAHWRAFRQCITIPVFALGEADDDKWQRFVTRFGFRFLRKVICINGETRRLFIHLVDGHA